MRTRDDPIVGREREKEKKNSYHGEYYALEYANESAHSLFLFDWSICYMLQWLAPSTHQAASLEQTPSLFLSFSLSFCFENELGSFFFYHHLFRAEGTYLQQRGRKRG